MAAPQINRSFSAFLDLVRIVAALVVFVSHFTVLPKSGAAWLQPYLVPYQHSAVIVFFVLSGYLISLAADHDGTAATYAVNRAARIYSVVLPALALTWGIDTFLAAYFPGSVGETYQLAHPWKYLPFFLVFATDFWFFAENAFSNVPYWSLCYEVWYYVVFGILFYGSGRMRWVAAAAALLLMGPRLWLLFPVWLMGVAVQVAHRHIEPAKSVARFLLVASLAAMVALKAAHIEDWCNAWFNDAVSGFAEEKLRYSKFFLGDYLFAGLTAVAVLAAHGVHMPALARAKAPLAALASISFSLYLVHYPTLQLFDNLVPEHPVVIAFCTLAVVAVIGIVFERRKDVLRRWLWLLAGPLRGRAIP